MGGSSSKAVTRNESNTLIVNKTSIDLLNESNTKIVQNTIIEMAKSAASSLASSQNMNLGSITATGGSKVIINKLGQTQNLTLNFTAVQSTTVVQQASNDIIKNMISHISTSVDNSVVTKMVADASASATSGFLALTPPPSSVSNATNINNTTIDNETFTKLSNVVSNTLENTFKQSSVDSCLSSLIANQNINITKIEASDNSSITLDSLMQDSTATTMQTCTQISDSMNKLTNNLLDTFGVTVIDDKKTQAEADLAAKAKAKAEARGPFESIGAMIKDIFGDYSYIAGIAFILCCCCCCLLLLLGGAGALYYMMSSNE